MMSNRLQGDIRLLAIFLSNCNSILPPEFFKDHFIHFEPVSVNAIILKDPPFSTLRAAQRIVWLCALDLHPT
jgi:hypothetical protein